MTDANETDRRLIRRQGRVTSDRMDKTIVLKVERLVRHPLYQKYIKRYTTLVAHDEANEARVGDEVEVEFTRPLSKRKRWRLVRIVRESARVSTGGAA